MDMLDHKILEILDADARRSYAERLTLLAESSTSVVLETHIPLRNPMLARPTAAARALQQDRKGVDAEGITS